MVDTTDFITTVNVRNLIAAYEHIAEQPIVPFINRQRARSLGNILSKNVVVRSNEFKTLADIESALRQVENDLNLYLTYDKEKHVSLQERLFNLLTCVVNIESETDDHDPIRKKHLITKTQTLVSFLNQKLPSNVTFNNNNGFKYKTYASFMDDKNKSPKQNLNNFAQNNLENNQYPEKVSEESSDETHGIVSVAKLKQNFQTSSPKRVKHQNEDVPRKPISKTKSTSHLSSVNQRLYDDELEPTSFENTADKIISVSKLRGLFEEKSKESNTGLEIIIKDQPTSSITGSNIPYIEGNLTNHRYLRANSGNYMEYARLIRSTDINRSKSAFDLNNNRKEFDIEKNDELELDSDVSSDNESIESVKEIKRSSSVENLPENIVKSTVNKYEGIITTAEAVVGASITVDDTPEETYIDTNDSETDEVKDNDVAIENADEIPENIVRLTKQVYENAAMERTSDDLSFKNLKTGKSEHKPINGVEKDIIPSVAQALEENVLNTSSMENGDILMEEYVVQPDKIPENIVQNTVEVYERSNLQTTLALDDEATDRGESYLTKQEDEMGYSTPQILDENSSQAVHSENIDMQEEEVRYSSATVDEDRIPENIVQKTIETFERASLETTLELDAQLTEKENGDTAEEYEITYSTPHISDENLSQPIIFANEDMQEEEIKYSSVTTYEDEIPENIVQNMVESYEHDVLDSTIEIDNESTGKVVTNIEEDKVTYSTIEIGDENSSEAVHFANDDMEEVDVRYSNATVDEDDSLVLSTQSSNQEMDPQLLRAIEGDETPYSLSVVNIDDVPRNVENHPASGSKDGLIPSSEEGSDEKNDFVKSDNEIDDIDLMLVNPEDLRRAEEEFELLVVGD